MRKRIAKKILSGILQGRGVKSEHIFNEACRRLDAKVYRIHLQDDNCAFARRNTNNTLLKADRITKIYNFKNS